MQQPKVVVLFVWLFAVCVSGAVSPLRATTLAFESTNPIIITDDGLVDPYPSSILVSNVTEPLAFVTITLHAFMHSYPDDVAAVVVGPTGEAVRLFDGPGSDIGNVVTWTFSDDADFMLPDHGPLSSGVYQPGQNEYHSFFPQVPGPIGTHLSAFVGSQPNGVWSLVASR